MPYDLPEEAMAPGTRPAGPSGTPLPPPNIPDHKLLRRIGGGSYGEVWLARNVVGTYRAVKVVYRKSFERDRPYDREFAGIQKFEPISRSHEGLVDILQIGRNDKAGYFYYVMELADAVGEAGEKVGEWESEKDATGSRLGPALLNPETYTPKTLRSLLRPNSQPSTLNVEQTTVPLPLAQCLDIGLALTAALAHLHKHGLVHRDVKPSNIIFVDGAPKLADIGLVTDMSEARSFVGTDGFIPPEGPGTPQADLYSLGKVLYEMSTGKDRHDFPELPPAMKESAERAGLSELNEIILKACVGDVRERYQDAEEMRADLALLQQGQSVKRRRALECRLALAKKLSLAAAALALLVTGGWLLSNRFAVVKVQQAAAPSSPASIPVAINSIAVLPFENESADKADENLGGQLAEELSIVLRKIPELHVKGRSTAAWLKKNTNVLASAHQMELTALLEGRVRKSGDRIHVAVQLANTRDGDQLWSDVYNGEAKDIFGIQTEIAQRVAEALRVELTDSLRARLALKTTKNFEAYQLFLEGTYWLHTRERENLRKAADYFQRAIALDTNHARAYAGLADCYNLFGEHGVASPMESEPKAHEAAQKARALDNQLAEAHAALALYKRQFTWDWLGAEQGFKRAIQLDPNYPWARQWYSQLLMVRGRPDESIAEIKRAIEVDPLAANLHLNLGIRLWDARRVKECNEQHRQSLDRFPDFAPLFDHALYSLWFAGDYEEAIALWEQSQMRSHASPDRIALLRTTFAKTGKRAYWQILLNDQLETPKGRYYSPFFVAVCYAHLGEKDQALNWLERTVEERHPNAQWIHLSPNFDSVRSEPRFKALLEKMGLANLQPTGITPAAVKSIAVLPFDNESPDKADEYLGTQIAEELSGALSKIAALRVLGRDSAVALKNAEDRRATAQQLKLDAMIVGKVRKTVPELHLAAEIINPADGQAAWSLPPYDGAMKDVFVVRSELVRNVARALNLKLTAADRQELELKPTLNLAAYEFYFLGRRHLNERTPASMRRAMECFQQAIQQDPIYARAYAGLADCYGLFPGAFPSYQEAWTHARESAENAVQFGPNVSEAHASLGLVLENFDWDWQGAEAEFERARGLDPNNATVRSWYAVHLARLGKFEAGIREARLAQEIDPLSAIRRWVLCWLLTADRQYAAAIEQFEHNLRLTPSQRAGQTVGHCYFYLGRYEAGIAAHQQAALGFGEDSEEVRTRYAALRAAYQASGPEGYWQKALELTRARWKEEDDATPIAVIYAWLGDKEQTLVWLEKAVAGRSHGIINLNLIPVLDLVRSEPRYQALLEKMGLPEPVRKQ